MEPDVSQSSHDTKTLLRNLFLNHLEHKVNKKPDVVVYDKFSVTDTVTDSH